MLKNLSGNIITKQKVLWKKTNYLKQKIAFSITINSHPKSFLNNKLNEDKECNNNRKLRKYHNDCNNPIIEFEDDNIPF